MALDREKIVATGRAYSGQALIDQADVSLAIAASDLAELKKWGWSDAKQKDLDKQRTAVRAGITAFGGAREAIPVATAKQREAMAAAKLWLRRAIPLAKNALDGVADLDSFLRMGDVTAVPDMGRALTDKVGILRRNAKLVATEGISAEFIKEGDRLAEALSAAEGAQEKDRKAFPKEAEAYAYQKGLLHRGLKNLNRVGQATFADDRAHKAKYSLEVLNRKASAPSRPKKEKVATP